MLILKQLAKEYDIPQRELAEILGITQSEVSKMMNGLREIKKEHISRLKAHFGDDMVSRFEVSEEQYLAMRGKFAKPINANILSAEVVEDIQSVPIDIYIEDMRKKDAEIYALNAEIRRQNERMDKLIEKLLER